MLLGDQLARVQAAANILGRCSVLRDSQRKTAAPLRFNASSRLQSTMFSAAAGDDAKLYTSFNLPPTGAIDYLRKLTPVTKDLFDGLTKQYQSEAFTVAGVADQRVLQRIRDEFANVIANGGTDADLRRAVDSVTSEAGVQRVAAQDIDNVFQSMSHKAYSVGRYEQMTDDSVMDALPYWQYWTVGDDRVRPEHRVLDRFCAQAIDPVWMKIYPPCGWGCRCSTVPISASEAPAGSDDGGLDRLPALAIALVPQPGYTNIMAFAA